MEPATQALATHVPLFIVYPAAQPHTALLVAVHAVDTTWLAPEHEEQTVQGAAPVAL